MLARGTPEQRATWAVPVLRLEKIGAWALTEPDAGSDAFGSMKTRAVREGEGFRVTGSKTFITNAPDADVFVVYARVEHEAGERVGAFLIDRKDPGVSTGPAMRKMGMHASPTGEIAIYYDRDAIPTGGVGLMAGTLFATIVANRAAFADACEAIWHEGAETIIVRRGEERP